MRKVLENCKNVFDKCLTLLYPNGIKCIYCGDEIKNENYNGACDKCFNFLENQGNLQICIRCGSVMTEGSTSVCFNCKRNNFNFEYARNCFSYEGIVKHAIYKFKYENTIEYAGHFARFMAELFSAQGWQIDLVTSVPLHPAQHKSRGYNQAALLALQFCKLVVLPYSDLAVRIKNTKTQTHLTSQQRKANVKDAFRITDDSKIKKEIAGKNILIIDDVYTTGATTNELARILKAAKANKIYVLTFAHTKLNRDF